MTVDCDCIPLAVEQEIWSRASNFFSERRYEEAALLFRKIGGKAKILYNIGICYLGMNDVESAVVAFCACLERDPYLTIAWYHLGYLYHIRQDKEKSKDYYLRCVQTFRDNGVIDYEQLGLNYRLCITEIFVNLAAIQMDLCLVGEATRSLVQGHEFRCKPEHGVIDLILLNPTTEWELFSPPTGIIFERSTTLPVNVTKEELKTNIDVNDGSKREVVQISPLENDQEIVFMAPIVKQAMDEEIDFSMQLQGYPTQASEDSSTLAIPLFYESPLLKEDFDDLIKLRFMDSENRIIQTRIIRMSSSHSLVELNEMIRRKSPEGMKFKLKYCDHEGDYITICDEEDYCLAMADAKIYRSGIQTKLVLYCYELLME